MGRREIVYVCSESADQDNVEMKCGCVTARHATNVLLIVFMVHMTFVYLYLNSKLCH